MKDAEEINKMSTDEELSFEGVVIKMVRYFLSVVEISVRYFKGVLKFSVRYILGVVHCAPSPRWPPMVECSQ